MRALARDVVDARRSIGEYYMVIVVLMIVLLVLPGTTTKIISEGIVVVLLTVLVLEGWLVGGKIKRLAAERYPGQSTRGVVVYTMMRNISLRRLRVPKPRVNRGDPV